MLYQTNLLLAVAAGLIQCTSVSSLPRGTSPQINFTDLSLFPSYPSPPSNYERYVTLLAVGWRNYTCSVPNATATPAYVLVSFDYDMFDLDEAEGALPVGKHVLLRERDYAGANSVFYTGVKTFTFW
jgi:hypothetical protein